MSVPSGTSSATRGPTRWIVGFFVLLTAVYATLGFRAWLRNQRTLEAIEALRGEVFQARSAAESCTTDLAVAESDFRQRNAALDSLRLRVRGSEEPLPQGGRGVPAEEYDAYLEAFDEYNASVAEWESGVEALREREGACRELVERHNLLADSLRRVLEENGIRL